MNRKFWFGSYCRKVPVALVSEPEAIVAALAGAA